MDFWIGVWYRLDSSHSSAPVYLAGESPPKRVRGIKQKNYSFMSVIFQVLRGYMPVIGLSVHASIEGNTTTILRLQDKGYGKDNTIPSALSRSFRMSRDTLADGDVGLCSINYQVWKAKFYSACIMSRVTVFVH
jgi:hypothetical protein